MIYFSNFYGIVVENGEQSKIIELLKLNELEVCSWDEGTTQVMGIYTEKWCYDNVMVSKKIDQWVYIICKKFMDSKYLLSTCNKLISTYPNVYSFVIDVHLGQYFFLKIRNGVIVRFFEHDANYNTGEFGLPIQEEIDLQKENESYDYPDVIKIAERVINPSDFSTNWNNQVIVGKRNWIDIERYQGNIDWLKSYKPDQPARDTNRDMDIEFPF